MTQTPDEMADVWWDADPLDTLRDAADLYRQPGDTANRALGAALAVDAAILRFHLDGATRDELAPLLALSGALRDHQIGVKADLLACARIDNRPHQGKSTRDSSRAAALAAVERLMALGARAGDAERAVGRAVGFDATRVHTWRKDGPRHRASIVFGLFADECANMSEAETLTALREYIARQP